MFTIYLRLFFSFIYFKVLKQSKNDMFHDIFKQFKNHQEPQCFSMVYNPYSKVVFAYPILTILIGSLSYLFCMKQRTLVFQQGGKINLDTPMLQYGKYGLMLFSISEFQEYLKSKNHYLVYIFSGDIYYLTVVEKLCNGCTLYTTNKHVIGNVTPYLLGEKSYIYSMVLRDMNSLELPIKPTFFQKFESKCLKSKIDNSGQNGINYFIKKHKVKLQINKLSDISNPDIVFGRYFGQEYSFVGFMDFLNDVGYKLNNDLSLVKC